MLLQRLRPRLGGLGLQRRRASSSSSSRPRDVRAAPVAGVVCALVAAGGAGLRSSSEGEFDEEFDYVVVGGGSAGCAAAARLALGAPAAKTLLLEAGPDQGHTRVLRCDFQLGVFERSRNASTVRDLEER